MELFLGEIRECLPVLNKLIDLELPINVSWRLSSALVELNNVNNKIEEIRVNLIKKFGVEHFECSDGESLKKVSKEEFENNKDVLVKQYQSIEPKIEVPEDKLQDFYSEWSVLLNEKHTLSFEQISISHLNENIKLTPKEMLLIKKFFKD